MPRISGTLLWKYIFPQKLSIFYMQSTLYSRNMHRIEPTHKHTNTNAKRNGANGLKSDSKGLQRHMGCLIFIVHFLQKSPVISTSFTERDLQIQVSYAASPPCACDSAHFEIHIDVYISVYIYIHMYIYLDIFICTHIYRYMHIHTHIQIYMHIYIYTRTQKKQSSW